MTGKKWKQQYTFYIYSHIFFKNWEMNSDFRFSADRQCWGSCSMLGTPLCYHTSDPGFTPSRYQIIRSPNILVVLDPIIFSSFHCRKIGVNLCIQSEYRKIQTRNNSVFGPRIGYCFKSLTALFILYRSRCYIKKVFLKIVQNSKKNTWIWLSLLMKLQA